MLNIVVFLSTVIIFSGIWMWNPFIATYLNVVLGSIVGAVLVISLLVERIERSNVPKSYFTVLTAILFGIIFSVVLQRFVFA